MYKFQKLNRGQKTPSPEDIRDFARIIRLCQIHQDALFDDFTLTRGVEPQGFSVLETIKGLIDDAGRRFWTIKRKRDGAFVGFAYLYDCVEGADGSLYSANVGTCFVREFWGDVTLRCGRKFLKYCFTKLGVKKLKAETMRSNPYGAGFLRRLGFDFEGVLKGETLLKGAAQDVLLWGLGAAKWYENIPRERPKSAVVRAVETSSVPPSSTGSRIKKRTLGVLDYTSRSINNKVILANFSKKGKKY